MNLVFPLVIVGSWAVFFADTLFSDKNFYFRDILNFHYPLRRLLIECYSRGEFPLWNPFLYLGQPMLANPNYMAFYPTNLLHVMFTFDYAFKLHFIIHPLMGGLGAYFLQRRLGILPLAALGGSVAYQFSGAVLSFLNLYNLVPAVALIPWSAWAFLRSLERNHIRRGLLFGSILALHIISFEPMLFQCNLLFLAGLGTWHVLESNSRPRAALDVLRSGLIGTAFGIALAAVQILPTLELLPLSARGAGFEYSLFSGWSTHPMDLLNLLVPNLFGNPFTIDRSTYWGEAFHRGREGYLVSAFQGTSVCFLSLLSILSPRKRLKWILGILLLISFVLALGEFNPVFRWLYDRIPLVRLGRYPSKYLLLVTVALTLLAALGIEALSRGFNERRQRVKFVVLAIIGGFGAMGLMGVWSYGRYNPQDVESWIRSFTDPALVGTKDFAAMGPSLMYCVGSSGAVLSIAILLAISRIFLKDLRLLGWALILLVASELMPANLRLLPLISAEDLNSEPEVFQYLRTEAFPKLSRIAPGAFMGIAPDQSVLAPNRSLAWLNRLNRLRGDPTYGIVHGVQYSLYNSVDGLNTRESQKLWEASLNLQPHERLTVLTRLNSPVVLTTEEFDDSRLRHLRAFDTRSDRELNVYWLENTITRAFFVPQADRVSSSDEALSTILDPGFRFGEKVLLEIELHRSNWQEGATGRVEIAEYENARVVLNVDAQAAGYVVLLDSYYPGWQAYVDGKETLIHRANYAFRAVKVEAGRHEVQFMYQPKAFYAGLWITCLAGLFGLIRGSWSSISSISNLQGGNKRKGATEGTLGRP